MQIPRILVSDNIDSANCDKWIQVGNFGLMKCHTNGEIRVVESTVMGRLG